MAGYLWVQCLCAIVMIHPEGDEGEVAFLNLEVCLISLKLKGTEIL